ncbi:hypothetical protein PV682_43045 [Streptomyces niveiscabiei]|uniref:hypothetical protein n=1 Tax=Streptomyces niveiscabiei TaxID=164115 RepID=UPI0029AF56DA|nr:hypothetical protein [Streptomyces niveiscabiei]MDX3388170.1 hypothetical protein [Streptomyces niveiscabiei]
MTDSSPRPPRRTGRTLKGYATNHASGAAVAIRPAWYPDGAEGGLFLHRLATVRGNLDEYRGVVAWGGDFRRARTGPASRSTYPPRTPA